MLKISPRNLFVRTKKNIEPLSDADESDDTTNEYHYSDEEKIQSAQHGANQVNPTENEDDSRIEANNSNMQSYLIRLKTHITRMHSK